MSALLHTNMSNCAISKHSMCVYSAHWLLIPFCHLPSLVERISTPNLISLEPKTTILHTFPSLERTKSRVTNSDDHVGLHPGTHQVIPIATTDTAGHSVHMLAHKLIN